MCFCEQASSGMAEEQNKSISQAYQNGALHKVPATLLHQHMRVLISMPSLGVMEESPQNRTLY